MRVLELTVVSGGVLFNSVSTLQENFYLMNRLCTRSSVLLLKHQANEPVNGGVTAWPCGFDRCQNTGWTDEKMKTLSIQKKKKNVNSCV